MFKPVPAGATFLAACLAFGALRSAGSTPTSPHPSRSSRWVSHQSNGPAVAPSARKLGYVSLPRVLAETAVGRESTRRVAEARAKGQGREVETEEQRRLQSLVQPLTQSLRERNGLGVILLWRSSQLCAWTDGTLDLTNVLKSMIDDGATGTVESGIRDARLGILDVRKLIEDSWLSAEISGGWRAPHPATALGNGQRGSAAKALEEFATRAYPSFVAFGREASVQLLLNHADAGIVWSDSRLDATEPFRSRLDQATHGKGPGVMPWSPPPAAVSYVRLRALADGASLARETRASIERLEGKLRGGQATDGDRRALADAQAKLKREMLEPLAGVAERECRARGITILLSFTDAGILVADPALDLTDTLVTALDRR